mmetsp:Transcript_9837/g.24066  ORF Transcript_9837/g.24066 Transcript_9837/m.24066 type:complete len:281 (+) Transcript_9837:285-1127(+)
MVERAQDLRLGADGCEPFGGHGSGAAAAADRDDLDGALLARATVDGAPDLAAGTGPEEVTNVVLLFDAAVLPGFSGIVVGRMAIVVGKGPDTVRIVVVVVSRRRMPLLRMLSGRPRPLPPARGVRKQAPLAIRILIPRRVALGRPRIDHPPLLRGGRRGCRITASAPIGPAPVAHDAPTVPGLLLVQIHEHVRVLAHVRLPLRDAPKLLRQQLRIQQADDVARVQPPPLVPPEQRGAVDERSVPGGVLHEHLHLGRDNAVSSVVAAAAVGTHGAAHGAPC